eukprot:6189169-Pleurochrysis_carterae.AAC.3
MMSPQQPDLRYVPVDLCYIAGQITYSGRLIYLKPFLHPPRLRAPEEGGERCPASQYLEHENASFSLVTRQHASRGEPACGLLLYCCSTVV